MQTRNGKAHARLVFAAIFAVTLLAGCGGSDNNVPPPPPPGNGYGYGPGYGPVACGAAGGEPVRRDGQPYYADLVGSNGGSIQLQLFYVNRIDDNYVQNVAGTATMNLPQLQYLAPGAAANPQLTTFCVSTSGQNGVNAPGQLFRDQTVAITLQGQVQMPQMTYSPFGGYPQGGGYGYGGQAPVIPVQVTVDIGKMGWAGLAQQRLQGIVGISLGLGWGNVYQAQ